MEINNINKDFVIAITKEVSKLIAQRENISIKKANDNFKNSKVYEFLMHPDVPFRGEDPTYFFECYENFKKYGLILDNVDLKIYKFGKKHPEIYYI